ncbi:hypothetical protein RKD52_000127 [Metabacillus sp. SLBN-84]
MLNLKMTTGRELLTVYVYNRNPFYYAPAGTNHIAGHANLYRQIENFGAKGALNAATLSFPQMLTYALQDEYLAQARYNNILGTFGYIPTFARIKEAELRHISALLPLFERYQVPIPEDISQSFVTTPPNIKAAYAAGVQGEIDNIGMYNRFLTFDIPSDARLVFTQLRDASLNHLAAFERGVGRRYQEPLSYF